MLIEEKILLGEGSGVPQAGSHTPSRVQEATSPRVGIQDSRPRERRSLCGAGSWGTVPGAGEQEMTVRVGKLEPLLVGGLVWFGFGLVFPL